MRYVLIFFFYILIAACAPCTDCERYADEPTITTSFYNRDSLIFMENLYSSVKYESDSIYALAQLYDDSITYWEDSLFILRDLISRGENWDTIIIYEKKILSQNLTEYYTTENATKESLLDGYDSLIDHLESGLVHITKIVNLNNDVSLENWKNDTEFDIPLDFEHDTTDILVTLYQTTFPLRWTYSRKFETLPTGEITVNVFNLKLESFNLKETEAFDSVYTNCENCIANEANFIFYY